MKPKTPRGIWALRAVTVAIAIIVIAAVGTVAYSAYEDYTAVRSEFAGGSSPAVAQVVRNGNSETVSLNISFANRGLYTLNVSVSCTYPDSNVVCQPAAVSVDPGQQGTLHFMMTVADLAEYQSSSDQTINGTVHVEMQPFVSLSIGTDFRSAVNGGSG